MYQPDAIATLIREVRPDAEVTSISPSRRGSDYPAQSHIKGPPGVDPAFINGFDCMLIGGGGLFAARHYPFAEPDWVAALTIPIFALSVGVAGVHLQDAAPFIRRCTRFSVRDEYSRAAVELVRGDAEIVMDPILLAEAAKPPLRAGRNRGVLWVPGKIVENTRPFWADVQARLISPDDPVMSFNPVTDAKSGFDEIFRPLTYLDAIEPFHAAAADARFTVSERYHGCIFALARGRPALGLATRSAVVTSKIRELYRRIGHPEAVIEKTDAHSRQSLRALADEIDHAAVSTYLLAERERLKDYLTACLA